MFLNVFIFGRPGSGKSSVAQFIQELAGEKGWSVEYIYDYKYLKELFLQEIDTNLSENQRRFLPIGSNKTQGFDVINFEVLDDVLDTIASQMMHEMRERKSAPLQEKKLRLIEFARNKYEDALGKFGDELLQDACLLYIQANIDNCIERIRRRVGDGFEFSHYVSEDIMRSYYTKDDWLEDPFNQYIKFIQSKGIRMYLKDIDNNSSVENMIESIRIFVEVYLTRETEAIPVVPKSVSRCESAK